MQLRHARSRNGHDLVVVAFSTVTLVFLQCTRSVRPKRQLLVVIGDSFTFAQLPWLDSLACAIFVQGQRKGAPHAPPANPDPPTPPAGVAQPSEQEQLCVSYFPNTINSLHRKPLSLRKCPNFCVTSSSHSAPFAARAKRFDEVSVFPSTKSQIVMCLEADLD